MNSVDHDQKPQNAAADSFYKLAYPKSLIKT